MYFVVSLEEEFENLNKFHTLPQLRSPRNEITSVKIDIGSTFDRIKYRSLGYRGLKQFITFPPSSEVIDI